MPRQGLLHLNARPHKRLPARGHWQYWVLPFGLHGARGVVVIHSVLWEDHLDRLKEVLMELQRARLTKPKEQKVEVVRQFNPPTTKTQVCAFLELVGYYRFFIPNFSSIACPLTDLTKKGVRTTHWPNDGIQQCG